MNILYIDIDIDAMISCAVGGTLLRGHPRQLLQWEELHQNHRPKCIHWTNEPWLMNQVVPPTKDNLLRKMIHWYTLN